MSITQYLRLVREQWLAVLLMTVLGVGGAGAYAWLATPEYQASAQLFVNTSGAVGDDLTAAVQGSTFMQQRVKSYADLVTSPGVLDPVIQQLQLDTTADALAGRVTTTSPLETVLLVITVTDPSPQRAADLANAIAGQFPELVNTLETPEGAKVSPVRVTQTRTALPAAAPVAPRTTLDLALGLLVGLGLGVGVAVLRDSLDRTVGGRGQAGQLAGAPVLGVVREDPATTEAPLITHDAFSARAEAFRQLRTNISFLNVDQRLRSFVITGSVQGEGKTTTAANIAVAMAQNGEPVALVDADLRRPTVAELFGLSSGVGLTSVLLGDAALDAALQPWRDDLPLRVLTSGPLPPNPSELIGSARMADVVRRLTDEGYTVVVDSPPLLPVTDAAILARITDGALVVARAASTRVEQFTTAIESLRTAGAPVLGVILNRVPKRGRSRHDGGYGYAGYTGYPPQPGPVPATARTVPAAVPVAAVPVAAPAAVPAAAVPAAAVPAAAVPAAAIGHPGYAAPVRAGGAMPGPGTAALPVHVDLTHAVPAHANGHRPAAGPSRSPSPYSSAPPSRRRHSWLPPGDA